MECCENQMEHENKKIKMIVNMIGVMLFVLAIFVKDIKYLGFGLFLTSYLCIGYDVLRNAVFGLFKKDMFNEYLLMSVATLGALCLGDFVEGIAVLLFYKLGEFLQDLAVDKSKKRVEGLFSNESNHVTIMKESLVERVEVEQVKIGDIMLVNTGEKILLDGSILERDATFDCSALTGESKLIQLRMGDAALSGYINAGSSIRIKVEKSFEYSTLAQIEKLIKEATSKKSSTEKYITRFAKIYTPIVLLIAAVLIFSLPVFFAISWTESVTRALNFLIISCPCALILSVPLGFFMGIGTAGKYGIMIKGTNYLDLLAQANIVAMDKTGTVTKGTFSVTSITAVQSFSKQEIMKYIAKIESFSNHYIARSIVNGYGENVDTSDVTEVQEIAGIGMQANIGKEKVLIGSSSILKDAMVEGKEVNGTSVHLVVDDIFQGYVVLSDEIKENMKQLVPKLKKLGVHKTIMLTGDENTVATKIGKELAMDEIYAKLLPEEKVKKLQELKKQGVVVYMGDGINDAPVISCSDVGVSMGKGSDLAINTADVVLLNDSPLKLIHGIRIARKTKQVVMQNIVLALGVKVIFLLLSTLGYASMWMAIFADVGVTLLAVLNCMQILIIKESTK